MKRKLIKNKQRQPAHRHTTELARAIADTKTGSLMTFHSMEAIKAYLQS